MLNGRTRLLPLLACLLGVLGGCASVPPAPPSAPKGSTTDSDEHEGWLFQSLTGGSNKASASPQQVAPQTDAVVQTSATSPWQPGAAGAVIPASAEGPAGPPPTIPPELPAAPAGAVSIGDIKPKEEEKKGFELADLAPENVYKKHREVDGLRS